MLGLILVIAMVAGFVACLIVEVRFWISLMVQAIDDDLQPGRDYAATSDAWYDAGCRGNRHQT